LKKLRGEILGYTPGPVPADLPPSARRYLEDELNRIAGVLLAMMVQSATSIRLAPMSAPPAAPTAPMIVYTDGTQWDPGSGEGFYYFNSNGVWTPLG
jgi:hypothetical protein